MLCLLLAATAGCDRVTKHLAVTTLAGMPERSYLGDTVRLDYHENAGGFMSAGANWPPAVRVAVFQGANATFLLGAIFMATDYVTSPMNPKSMIIYGCGIGILTVIIRAWGAYPEGVSFAILIMNAFVPLMNSYIKPKRFGEEVKNG